MDILSPELHFWLMDHNILRHSVYQRGTPSGLHFFSMRFTFSRQPLTPITASPTIDTTLHSNYSSFKTILTAEAAAAAASRVTLANSLSKEIAARQRQPNLTIKKS